MAKEIYGQAVKYEGTINVLRQYPDKAYSTGPVRFIVENHALVIPALPFIIINLKENAKTIMKQGWRFNCGNITFFVPPEEVQSALYRYTSELQNNIIERFLDPYGNE